jgi:hypothetical protein
LGAWAVRATGGAVTMRQRPDLCEESGPEIAVRTPRRIMQRPQDVCRRQSPKVDV